MVEGEEMTKPTYRLHLIREREPDGKDLMNLHARAHKVFCPDCGHDVHIIHIDVPPVDPPKRRGMP